MIQIASAYDRLDEIRVLFKEYACGLGVDLCFQSFDNELASLPGRYALPSGRLYLAVENGKSAGCIALRPLGSGVCEMKRLYVRPEYRGSGWGESLAQRVINDAKSIGYRQIVLDTLDSMKPAVRLYQKMGFRFIEPYYDNPITGAVYMGRDLNTQDSSK